MLDFYTLIITALKILTHTIFKNSCFANIDNFILRIIDVYEMPGWKDSLEEFMKEKREG